MFTFNKAAFKNSFNLSEHIASIQHFSCVIHKFTCTRVEMYRKGYAGSVKGIVGDGKGKRGCWVNSGLQTPTLIQ